MTSLHFSDYQLAVIDSWSQLFYPLLFLQPTIQAHSFVHSDTHFPKGTMNFVYEQSSSCSNKSFWQTIAQGCRELNLDKRWLCRGRYALPIQTALVVTCTAGLWDSQSCLTYTCLYIPDTNYKIIHNNSLNHLIIRDSSTYEWQFISHRQFILWGQTSTETVNDLEQCITMNSSLTTIQEHEGKHDIILL